MLAIKKSPCPAVFAFTTLRYGGERRQKGKTADKHGKKNL
jgi:hypothetical protein